MSVGAVLFRRVVVLSDHLSKRSAARNAEPRFVISMITGFLVSAVLHGLARQQEMHERMRLASRFVREYGLSTQWALN